ncbi:MAG: type III polyketide synthase [Azospirillaceae bacterium]|nr:type III polyketide synthase [Azospirillaceae bacterium]
MSTLPTARLLSLATAVPPYKIDQTAAREAAREIFGSQSAEMARNFERLAPVFTNAGIETRYSSVPLDWYRTPRTWPERNAAFLTSADALLERAARQALDRACLGPRDIAAIVAVSSTGIATPSLDARLMQRLDFSPETQRLPVFGLGCAGGVLGLARAAAWAQSMPGRPVLVLVVELCGLSFRHGDLAKANVVATALFGDGAAAAVVCADPTPNTGPGAAPALRVWGEHTWPDTLDIMGWRVESDGFAVIFSQHIPSLTRTRMRPAADAFLARHGLNFDDFAGVICHPGGTKVIEALGEVFAPHTDGLDDAQTVLRDYGNMSAPTVLFVLERRRGRGITGRHLMTTLGPGFSAGFLVIDL